MENINEKIKGLEKDLNEAMRKKVQIDSDIRDMQMSIDKLKAELNKKLSVHKNEFYLQFIDKGAKFADVIYINDITEDGKIDTIVYEFFDVEVHVEKITMHEEDFKDARYITQREWMNYFFPLVLNPTDLRNIMECLEKAYNSEDILRLESFGTGPGSRRRSIEPYTLDELLVREGYKKVV